MTVVFSMARAHAAGGGGSGWPRSRRFEGHLRIVRFSCLPRIYVALIGVVINALRNRFAPASER